MPAGGWIPLWRKAFKSKWSPANQGRPYTEFEAWLDLLCLVVQKPDGDVVKMPGKQPYFLGSGEILTTFRGLQARWMWGSHNKVRRFIRSLCTLESVLILDTNPLHLKIINAETYGLVRTKNGPRTDQARTKNGPVQQVNNDEQVKQVNKTTTPVGGPFPAEFLEFWNQSGFTAARKIEGKRSKVLGARRKDDDWNDHWREALLKAAGVDWLNGKGHRGYVMTIDFFLKPDSLTRILEDKGSGKPNTSDYQARSSYEIPEDLK